MHETTIRKCLRDNLSGMTLSSAEEARILRRAMSDERAALLSPAPLLAAAAVAVCMLLVPVTAASEALTMLPF